MSKQTPVYQVSDLLNEMRRLMEVSYPEIWIEGELSSLSTPASGHLYFSLKDEQSQLRCAMFRNRASINRYKPNVGDLVRVRAKISVYTARGDLQCIVQHIEEAGEGLLQRRFEELKAKLNSQGLFNSEHKQQLPSFAKRIGIITSPTGAAVKDILSTLKRRCPGIPITIYPAVVQGETAAKTIIEAIQNATRHNQCDVLIVTRGGGSLEDLWCFNDEQLANTIFTSPIPIVSAVGHEVDITISDLVADQRAPTPTAAAEILSPDTTTLQNQLRSLSYRLANNSKRHFQYKAQNVDSLFRQLVHPKQQLKLNQERLQVVSKILKQTVQRTLTQKTANLSQSQQRLTAQSPHKKLEQLQKQSQSLADRLLLAKTQKLKSYQQQYLTFSKTLHAVSPLATLDRGFSITRKTDNAILRNVDDIDVDETIQVQLKSGSLKCTVNEIAEKNHA